jgi:hypothetical protein
MEKIKIIHFKLVSAVAFTIFLLSIVMINLANAQESPKKFPNLMGPYLGQNPPGNNAIVFASGIVSTDQHEHSRLTFSKNGSALYWAVIPIDSEKVKKGERPYLANEQKIWYSKLEKNEWIKPTVLDINLEISKKSGVWSPTFSPDGNIFYYQLKKSVTNHNSDHASKIEKDEVWKVNYNNGCWGDPALENDLLPIQENKLCMSFCFSNNGNLYFDLGGPDKNGEWLWNIYFSEFKNGVYSAPVKLGNGINDFSINWCPWIAPDESYMIFSSHREGDFGDGDLYISFKIYNEWSRPVNMGPKVNTSAQERFPSVSPDGKYLFYARHTGKTFNDIFWIMASFIEDLKLKEK